MINADFLLIALYHYLVASPLKPSYANHFFICSGGYESAPTHNPKYISFVLLIKRFVPLFFRWHNHHFLTPRLWTACLPKKLL